MHDARVLRLSGFFNRVSQGQIEAFANGTMQDINGLDVALFIVGDGAYPLQEWLLKPYPKIGVLAQDEKRFNKELSKASVKVEHCFGMLKGRWRILKNVILDDLQKVPLIVLYCCILHNICTFQNNVYSGHDNDYDDSDDDNDDYGCNQSGIQVRDAIKDFLQ